MRIKHLGKAKRPGFINERKPGEVRASELVSKVVISPTASPALIEELNFAHINPSFVQNKEWRKGGK